MRVLQPVLARQVPVGAQAAVITSYSIHYTKLYEIKDNADILAIMAAAWEGASDVAKVASTLLADSRLWGEDLTSYNFV